MPPPLLNRSKASAIPVAESKPVPGAQSPLASEREIYGILDRVRYLPLKRAADLLMASILIVAAAPFVLVCAGLIRITSRGPAFYTQMRLGLLGKPFLIIKLRTMTHNCEKTSGARWAMRNDPRVTMIGKLLRLTHFDELPQLWNVLKGEMSLVGPRPERPEFIPTLEKSIPNYRRRLLIKPGVTGLAQVFLPPDTGIQSVATKLQYDLHYVGIMNLFLDLRLILATALQAVGVPCPLVRWTLFLPKPKTPGSQPPIAQTRPVSHPSEPHVGSNGHAGNLSFEHQPEATA